MKKILMAVVMLGCGVAANAQSVSPVYTEAKMKKVVKGEFLVINQGLVPMPTVIEPRELTSTPDGHAGFKPLSDDVKVELSETSFVAPPKSTHTVTYKIVCTRDCPVSFFAGMMTGKAVGNGVSLRIIMPSTVYSCLNTSKDCRAKTKAALHITKD